MPTDNDLADDRGCNAARQAAKDYLYTESAEIKRLHDGFNVATKYGEDNPFSEAYIESQQEVRKRDR